MQVFTNIGILGYHRDGSHLTPSAGHPLPWIPAYHLRLNLCLYAVNDIFAPVCH